ncbi:MAG: tagaturonate epimerase family protein, partial [bacterium]|nr:tagaturonate epimerase family protein [bacterium]
GSDKFSIYPSIGRVLKKFNTGVHIKTAGTTWLEEIIGLAEAGNEGLAIAKEIYRNAFQRFEELSKPYATVIDIDSTKLPDPAQVAKWDGAAFADTLRHEKTNPRYNPSFRQLLHVGYKIAAEMKERYLAALTEFEDVIARNVTQNIFERHIKPIFMI